MWSARSEGQETQHKCDWWYFLSNSWSHRAKVTSFKVSAQSWETEKAGFSSVTSGFLRVFLCVSYGGARPLESTPDGCRRAWSEPAASAPASSGHWVSAEEADGVTGQEDGEDGGKNRSCTFQIAASWMFVLLVTAPNLQTMAVITALFTVSACCLASRTHSAGCPFSTHAVDTREWFISALLSLPGWLSGEPWWPGSGVFSVLRHLPPWRVWENGGDTETQDSAGRRNGEWRAWLIKKVGCWRLRLAAISAVAAHHREQSLAQAKGDNTASQTR